MEQAEALVQFLRLWAYTGAAVAVAFLTFGIDRIDTDARGAYPFRLLLVPGILLIWPLVLWRWYVLEAGRDAWRKRHAPPRVGHGVVGVLLPLCLIAVLVAGVSQRQTWPADVEPVQISAPQEQSE